MGDRLLAVILHLFSNDPTITLEVETGRLYGPVHAGTLAERLQSLLKQSPKGKSENKFSLKLRSRLQDRVKYNDEGEPFLDPASRELIGSSRFI
jgi:hypothetical protein